MRRAWGRVGQDRPQGAQRLKAALQNPALPLPHPRLPAQRASPGCWGKSGGRGADHWVCPKPPLQLRKAKVKLKLVHKTKIHPNYRLCNRCASSLVCTNPSGL